MFDCSIAGVLYSLIQRLSERLSRGSSPRGRNPKSGLDPNNPSRRREWLNEKRAMPSAQTTDLREICLAGPARGSSKWLLLTKE